MTLFLAVLPVLRELGYYRKSFVYFFRENNPNNNNRRLTLTEKVVIIAAEDRQNITGAVGSLAVIAGYKQAV